MFSSNSFNVCPHCGKANSLNARYCSSCGKQLTVPEEVIVCPKCHKTNSPLASFCGGCGTQLRTGQQTKICPRCHKDVDVNESLCSCGYSFSGVKYATPTKKEKKVPVKREKAVKNEKAPSIHKGGRAVAVVGLIFLLVFAYLVIVPQSVVRPELITDMDKGLLVVGDKPLYVYDLVMLTVGAFTEGGGFESITSQIGIGGFVVTVLGVLFALTVVLHLLVVIIRLITGTRGKHASKFMLIMAVVNTVLVAFSVLFKMLISENSEGFVATLRGIFVPACDSGYVLYVLPAYYWFFTLFSAFTKAKKIKENVA